MFGQISQPYMLQVAALWCSFVPALLLIALSVCAQVERIRRRTRRKPALVTSYRRKTHTRRFPAIATPANSWRRCSRPIPIRTIL
jgi:hypothetical protein